MADAFAKLDDKKWRRFVELLGLKLGEIKNGAAEYVKEVAPIAEQDVKKHFREEMGPDGKWDEWSESYHKFLIKIGKAGNQILQDNRDLRKNVIPAFGIKGKPNTIPILVNQAKTKDGFPYAKHHDEGRSSWRGNSRTYMWLSDVAAENIAIESLDFLLKGLRGR